MSWANIPAIEPEWVPEGTHAVDWLYALDRARFYTSTASFPSVPCNPATYDDVEKVESFWLSYHGEPWTPENRSWGSELCLVALLRLKSGLWMFLEAWNDYTGWECMDGAEAKIGTYEEVIRWGMTDDARRRLGLEDEAD